MDPGEWAGIITAAGGGLAALGTMSYNLAQALKAHAEREAIETDAADERAADRALLQTVVRDLGLLMLDIAAIRDEQLDHADQIRALQQGREKP